MPSSEMKALISSARSAGSASRCSRRMVGHLGQHLAQVQLRQRRAVVLVDEGLDLVFQLADTRAAVAAGPVQQHVGHRLRLAFHQAQQQAQQFLAPARRQPPDHAEVDEGDAVARQVEHVAGVRVGVEEAVLDDHLQHRLRAAAGQQRGPGPRGRTRSRSCPGCRRRSPAR
jgi:hypothetical protein